MTKHRRKYCLAALIVLAVPLFISPNLPGVFTTPAWADDDGYSTLVVNPTSLAFTYRRGGSLPSSQSLSVKTNNYTTVSYTDSISGGSWIKVSRTSGTTPSYISVSVAPGTLAVGTYTAYVTVSSNGGSVHVPVTLTITSGTSGGFAVSPSSLAFGYQQGGTLPASQNLSVTDGTAVSFSDSGSGATWLSVNSTSGTTPGSIKVSANPGSMAVGTYTASVKVSSSAGSVTVPVTLTITSAPGSGFAVTPSSLAFGYQQGGTLPVSQTLSVTDGATVSFSDAASGGSWLSLSRTSGTTPGSIQVSASPGSMGVGVYTGSVTVTSSAGSSTVPVTLTITAASSGGGSGSNGYVLLAWSELGMHCMDGKDYSIFSVLPPYNTIYAKLLTAGSTPTEVTSGVTITYQAMKDASGSINTTSAGSALSPYNTTANTVQKTNFWDWVSKLFLGGAAPPPPDVGLHNYAVQSLTPQQMTYGSMALDSALNLWKAEGVPTAPYDDTLASQAYPMVQLVAKNSSGQTIATATVVPAVSDEMSCANCHNSGNSAAVPSGGWVSQGTTNQTMKLMILKKHDDLSPISSAVLSALAAKGITRYQASLYQTALDGGKMDNPVLCADCHLSNALNAAGLNTGLKDASGNLLVRPMTTAMHSLHSSQTLPGSTTTLDNMTSPTNVGCYQCHPGVNTKCQRGAMTGTIPGSTAETCYSCHGNLTAVGNPARNGWLDEPNCQMCHQGGTTYTSAFSSGTTYRTSTDTTFATTPNVPMAPFSLYRYSQGHGAVECAACHGSQHAEYPTNQPNDQVYSTNLQGYAGRVTECTVCHGTSLATTSNGGPHGMHTVGAAWVSAHPNYAEGGGSAACTYCHGADYRGTPLSMILTSKTLAGRTFPAYHQMNCYDCHNGPNGG